MKIRESGMPEAGYWESLFDVPRVLTAMHLDNRVKDAVEFGCGYGTFAIPAARVVRGKLIALEIDPVLIEFMRLRAGPEHIENLDVRLRDFMTDGSGLPDGYADYVMLFNILHAEYPMRLLGEAYRILSPGGRVGVIHWCYDPDTPRGPPMNIRPRPEDCCRWLEEAGFMVEKPHIDLPPFHYGILATR